MRQDQKEFTYGAVLKIEREHTREDIRGMLTGMRELGMNTAVVWPAVYWWEKEGEHYPYQTGRDLLADAEEIGIRIVMELAGQITAMEYAPDFWMKDDYFCVDRSGVRDEGSLGYGYLNFNHPEVQELIRKQYGEAAREYKDFPALQGYDIWNETQFTSFDDYTLERFRGWLKEKYGTIGRLNDSWDRAYRDWKDVRFTQWMWASVMPFVDYQEFHKDNIGMILRDMRAAIEAEDTAHEILADNIHASVTMDQYYDRPSDDWAVAREVDQYGISFYPKFLSKMTPPALRHQTMTGAHSAAPDGRFAISEMQTHHATMFNPEGSVSPEELRQWCWEAVSHGANGLIYWKWNPFRKGVQTFGRGLVDLQGRETPRTGAAREIGRVLAQENGFAGCRPQKPAAAILYDRMNQDFTKAYTIGFRGTIGAPDSIYLDSIKGLYETLWRQNIPVRFVTPSELIAGEAADIPVLFITTQVEMWKELADAILDYTRQGGLCICDGKFGEVNETGLLYPQIPGEGLSEALGFELLDIEDGDLDILLPGGETVCGGHDRRQMLFDTERVQVLAAYADGSPAAVCAPYGDGRFCYLSTFLWTACRNREQNGAKLLGQIAGDALTASVTCDAADVCIQRLVGEDREYVFAFNYGEERSVKIAEAAAGGSAAAGAVCDVLTGEKYKTTVIDNMLVWEATLPAGAVAIYRLSAGPDAGGSAADKSSAAGGGEG